MEVVSNRLIKMAFSDKMKTICQQSNMDHQIGSCIFKSNKILSVGYNYNDRNFIHGKHLYCIHSEIDALLNLDKLIVKRNYSCLSSCSFSQNQSQQWKNRNRNRRRKKRRRKLQLMVVRFTKDGQAALSKPCFHCLTYLKQFNHYNQHKFQSYVKEIYYFNAQGILVYEKLDSIQETYMTNSLSNIIQQHQREKFREYLRAY